MKLDLLAFGAHPDDVELACSGTIALHTQKGYKAGIVDLTRGELGTRGTPEIRDQEAKASAKVLGLSIRENLAMADGFFRNDYQHQLPIIRMIRRYRPEVVLANAPHDRHPDHGRGGDLVREAWFLAGLRKIETLWEGQPQEAWRPHVLYRYIQDRYIVPDFVVDITSVAETKDAAIRAYQSQFYNPNSNEPETYISSPQFMHFIWARAQEYGHQAGFQYGEAFVKDKMLGVRNLFDLV